MARNYSGGNSPVWQLGRLNHVAIAVTNISKQFRRYLFHRYPLLNGTCFIFKVHAHSKNENL